MFAAIRDHADGEGQKHVSAHASGADACADAHVVLQRTRPRAHARGAHHEHGYGHVRSLHGCEGENDVLETKRRLLLP